MNIHFNFLRHFAVLTIIILNLFGEKTMADLKEVLSSIKLNNEEYFSLNQEKIDSLDEQLADLNRFDAILLKAPDVIDLNKFASFPVLQIMQNDDKREWMVPELRNMLAVVYNKTTGELITGPARKDKKKINYSAYDHDDKLPDNLSTTGYSTGCQIFDLKFSLGIPWVQSHYLVSLVNFDWVSNKVDVFLKKPGDNSVDKPTFQSLPKNEPVIDAISNTGKDQIEPSVTFSIPAKCSSNPEQFQIQGKFQLPMHANEIFTLEDKQSAMIPVYALIVEKNMDQRSPIIARWYIKTDLPKDPDVVSIAEGIFKFKLSDLVPETRKYPLKPKEYCCYIVAQGTCFGPQKITIVK